MFLLLVVFNSKCIGLMQLHNCNPFLVAFRFLCLCYRKWRCCCFSFGCRHTSTSIATQRKFNSKMQLCSVWLHNVHATRAHFFVYYYVIVFSRNDAPHIIIVILNTVEYTKQITIEATLLLCHFNRIYKGHIPFSFFWIDTDHAWHVRNSKQYFPFHLLCNAALRQFGRCGYDWQSSTVNHNQNVISSSKKVCVKQ